MNDPFWGVVRRKHRDIDLIVLDGPWDRAEDAGSWLNRSTEGKQ